GGEPPALLHGARRRGHDRRIVAGACHQGEGPSPDPPQVERRRRAVDYSIDSRLEFGRDLEVLGHLVRGAARDQPERDVGAGEPRGGLGERAIPADNAYGAVAEPGAGAGKLDGVPRAARLHEVEGRTACGESTADHAAKARRIVLTGLRVQDDERPAGVGVLPQKLLGLHAAKDTRRPELRSRFVCAGITLRGVGVAWTRRTRASRSEPPLAEEEEPHDALLLRGVERQSAQEAILPEELARPRGREPPFDACTEELGRALGRRERAAECDVPVLTQVSPDLDLRAGEDAVEPAPLGRRALPLRNGEVVDEPEVGDERLEPRRDGSRGDQLPGAGEQIEADPRA